MSQNATDIRNKLEQLSEDMRLAHRFVQGTDTETVPLGTPPVPTPSLRKLAKDIDARESQAAQNVINGATDRIHAEGTAQEARVLAAGEAQASRVNSAGETQTVRVNEAGETQFNRVNTEGNAQFSRVNTEGNTQYARVNEAGETQTAQVNSAGQTQHAGITTTANALLADINTQGMARKEELTSTGAAFLLQISANGDAQNTRLTTTGATEGQKLRATGDAQRIIVILEGDTQVQRLAESGNTLNATLLNLVREAALSAKEAAQSADKAVDMTHVGPAGKGKFGFVRIGSGIDVTEEGEISVAFPAVVSTPAVNFPAVVGIGYEYELSMSAESAVYGADIATFIIAVDEDYVREIPAVGNAATHTLSIEGVPGTTGRIVVTAVDDLGNMSLDSVTTFQRNAVVIATPRVLSPVDAATDVSLAPRITVQPMQVSGVPATCEHTQIQIAEGEDFAVCVLDTGEDAPYTTQYQCADDLQKNTVYHARVRHRAALYGWSPWSTAALFETMDCFVDVPVIYAPLNDITDVALRPTISVAAFTNTGPVDTPTATQIQIATNAGFANIVAQHDGGYVTIFAPTADLALITSYYTRARHKGARWEWSAWSQTTRFTTLNAYTQPATLTYPANGAVGVPLLATVRVADFANVGPADTATGTHMQVARDADFTNVVAEYNGDYTVAWTLPAFLVKNTEHFARARHKGLRWGWGQWGAVAAFTSEDAFVRTPTVTAPVNGSTGVALRPTISFSAFANAGPVDNAVNTHFQVARDAAFINLIHDSGDAGGHVTTWTPGGNLALNAPHYVRVRHKGVLWGWSAWSAVVGFTTLNAYVNAPVVTAPANNATGVALRPTITLSGFSNVGPADTGNGTQIQIALDAAFTNVVASYASAHTTSWTPGNNLGINTPYFVRARHSGATWGWGAWGEAVKFQTQNVTLAVSQFTQPVNGATEVNLTPTFKWAAPVAVNQTFTEDGIMIATEPSFTAPIVYGAPNLSREYTVAAGVLAVNTLYYARNYARGSITGYTFGPAISFRTVNGWVNAPTLTSPTTWAAVAGDEAYFASSTFSVSHTTDTHVATEFALNRSGLTAWRSGELTGANLLAFKARIPDFTEGWEYQALVRHRGRNLGWSEWSTPVSVTIFKRSLCVAYNNYEHRCVDTTSKNAVFKLSRSIAFRIDETDQLCLFDNSGAGSNAFRDLKNTPVLVYSGTSYSGSPSPIITYGDYAYALDRIYGGYGLYRWQYKVGRATTKIVTYNDESKVLLRRGNILVIGGNNGFGHYYNITTGQSLDTSQLANNGHASTGFVDIKRGRFVLSDAWYNTSESTDGITWRPSNIPPFTVANAYGGTVDVAQSNDGWLALLVRDDISVDPQAHGMRLSTDGTAFKKVSAPTGYAFSTNSRLAFFPKTNVLLASLSVGNAYPNALFIYENSAWRQVIQEVAINIVGIYPYNYPRY